jgi:hypothetical protein
VPGNQKEGAHISTDHVGTAALGCPAERSSAVLLCTSSGEHRPMHLGSCARWARTRLMGSRPGTAVPGYRLPLLRSWVCAQAHSCRLPRPLPRFRPNASSELSSRPPESDFRPVKRPVKQFQQPQAALAYEAVNQHPISRVHQRVNAMGIVAD